MNSELRRQVLGCFKQLHRTRLKVFEGDARALIAARQRINEEFAKNRNISDAEDVKKLVDFGHQVEEVLCKSVVQAVQKEDGVYTAKIREETTRLDNKPYNEMPESLIGPFKKKRTKCSDPEK
ncbi:complex III assembly factor LYRM7-like [Penaeus chinensis]|uniref:complex III assembly factor LYRM7-like n=1 Tax=Penaeus chinensis TaxID=139456 RepID=UPI001FB83B5B|nr:complex III assembly factor LYRM7-like [Penaeus chinensis]